MGSHLPSLKGTIWCPSRELAEVEELEDEALRIEERYLGVGEALDNKLDPGKIVNSPPQATWRVEWVDLLRSLGSYINDSL